MWNRLKSEAIEQCDIFDRKIEAWVAGYRLLGGRIFCTKGCGNCCSLAVNCTFTEALCTAGSLTTPQALQVRRHALGLKSLVNEASDFASFLKMHRKQLGFCPLLSEEGSCGAYAKRPLACRSLLATKDKSWCGADFGALPPEEKQAFIESLDRNVVAFPMHYVCATQDIGQEVETGLAQQMTKHFGFSLYGNFPVLIYLEIEHHLSETIRQGYDATFSLLNREGFAHPFLTTIFSKK